MIISVINVYHNEDIRTPVIRGADVIFNSCFLSYCASILMINFVKMCNIIEFGTKVT